VIESSNNLTFAPYDFCYPHLDEHVKAVGFNVEATKWNLIFDFTPRNDG
jgi:hypothetical protein